MRWTKSGGASHAEANDWSYKIERQGLVWMICGAGPGGSFVTFETGLESSARKMCENHNRDYVRGMR